MSTSSIGTSCQAASHAQPQSLAQEMLAATSKQARSAAILMLADGTVFYGFSCGAEGEATGEVCFNTSLVVNVVRSFQQAQARR